MITLKESILSRSSHGGGRFKTMTMIENWLKEYNIENYNINYDLTIDVEENINFLNKNITKFPDYIQFGEVKGNFDCSSNNLISLKGCPKYVDGFFNCSYNKLTSLEGAPKEVGVDFFCHYNKLTSLEGAPKEVGGTFYCFNNKLTSLEGAPERIGGDFDCSSNQLTSLEGAPKEVGGDFDCSRNEVQFIRKDIKKICNVKGVVRIK